MNFQEKLQLFLEGKTEPTPVGSINTNPEGRVNPEGSLKIPDDVKTLQQFFTLVNPLRGEVKRCSLFRYVKEFRSRGKDVLILKNGTKEILPFFSIDRGQLSAYLASIMEDEQAMKEFTAQIDTIYTQEEAELQPTDYIDFVIKNKISIMSNPAIEFFGVDSASESIPSINTPKNQEPLAVDPQKVEDSEGLSKKEHDKKEE